MQFPPTPASVVYLHNNKWFTARLSDHLLFVSPNYWVLHSSSFLFLLAASTPLLSHGYATLPNGLLHLLCGNRLRLDRPRPIKNCYPKHCFHFFLPSVAYPFFRHANLQWRYDAAGMRYGIYFFDHTQQVIHTCLPLAGIPWSTHDLRPLRQVTSVRKKTQVPRS